MNLDHGRKGWMAGCAGLISAIAVGGFAPPRAQAGVIGPTASWTRPVAPFHIVGDVYYVGSKGLAAYLITSPQGDILLDGTLAENAPLIERNIAKLGFRLKDVKLLVNSHAHSDHAGGLARLKHDTGAQMLASAGDRWALEHGRSRGDNIYAPSLFPPVRVDREIREGETVRLGDIALTAHLTPGHTPGCTSWSLPARDGGRTLQVVIPCSLTVAGNVLVGNGAYPNIVPDYRLSFARLKALKADVVLTNHPEMVDVLGRHRRQVAGQADAFVDRGALPRLVSEARADFEAELAKQAMADQASPRAGLVAKSR